MTILRRRVACKFGLHDLAAKSYPAYNFIILNQMLKLCHRNDHYFQMMCRALHLVRYLEGQGHSMTSKQNCVRPITLLFEVGFYNYFWPTSSLCPILFRGALPGTTGSCFYMSVVVFWVNLCCFVCVLLYGWFCHGALKLGMSLLFTNFFLLTYFKFILQ